MNPMMQAFLQFIQNPAAFFQQRGMQMPPQSALQSPQSMIQYIMSTGGVSQEDFNRVAARSRELQQHPQFMHMMQGMFRR